MTFPSSTALQVMFAVAIVIFTAYAAGRVHQWYRHGFEREEAFRAGYNQASRALFHLATRNVSGKATLDGHADGSQHPAMTVPASRGRHVREAEHTRLDAGAA